ncbi:MAG TPA: imidazolonepropionase [Actinomycetota bacterium]|nr:imidazolonepropionase [Actinomycetota bacterium]
MTCGAAVAAAMATAHGDRATTEAAEWIEGGAGVAWGDDGTITYVGSAGQLPWGPTLGDADRGCLVPGFVDAHTHLPFVGWRADEFEARLRGVSYRELHGGDGGIFRSARMFAEASDDEVLGFSRTLLDEMLAHGTTAVELKTGYGLSIEQEVRAARLARRLAEEAVQTCVVTLLAAHAVPSHMERGAWVQAACTELIPAVARAGLADAVDVYVEDIAFSLDDLEAIAGAASGAGLSLRVHADQLGDSGATSAAARLGARSADHLNHCSADGVEALATSDTVAGLLPASTFFLRGKPAPTTAMRAAGVPIALASDANPGTSPVVSMPEVIAMAAGVYEVPPLEALTAATLNPAWVLGLAERVGSLEVGKRADLALLEEASFAQVPYRPGHDPVVATVVGGELARSHA